MYQKANCLSGCQLHPRLALSKAHGPPGNGHLDRREHRLELHAGKDKIITRRPSLSPPPPPCLLSVFLSFFFSFLPQIDPVRANLVEKEKKFRGTRVGDVSSFARETGEGNLRFMRLVAVNRLESCFREASVEFDREMTNGIRETRRGYFFSRRICQNLKRR